MGRPTKRTDAARKAIIEAVEKGASDRAAYGAAGISESTFYDWVRDDAGFSEALTHARARAVKKAEEMVFGDNPLTWLQRGPGRKFASVDEAWSATAQVEVTTTQKPADLSKLTAKELRTLHELTAKAESGGSDA